MQLVQKVQLYGIKLHGLVFTITESGLSILTEKCPITIPFLLWEYLKFSLRKHFSDFHAAGMCWLHFPDSIKKKKKNMSPKEWNGYIYTMYGLVAQMVKNLPAVQETCVWSLSWEDALEEGMATHSSILAWRIPSGQRNLVGCSLWGHKESDMTEGLTFPHVWLTPFAVHLKLSQHY